MCIQESARANLIIKVFFSNLKGIKNVHVHISYFDFKISFQIIRFCIFLFKNIHMTFE